MVEMLSAQTAVSLSVYFALFGVSFSTASASSANIAVKRLSPCSVEVEGGIVDLSSLQRRDGYPRFTVVYGSWNYSFNPCDAYNEPRDPHGLSNVFGDKCLHVSLCKFKTVGMRKFYYSIGTQSSAFFSAQKNTVKNATEVELIFTGTRSMVSKQVRMRLVCDKTRIKPEDADFRITADKTRGNIYAELSHVCACPGVCAGTLPPPLNGNITGNRIAAGDASKEPSGPGNSNAHSLLIVFGINIGLLILAVFIGGLCYSKRSALRSYNKLPGLHPHWSGSGKHGRIEKFPTIGVESSRKAYRDYESSETKTPLPPVLEDCEIPVGHLEVKQRLGGNIFGDTYKGCWKDTLVAIKCITHGIQLSENHSEVVRKIRAEVSLLSKQRHKNIAAMIGMCLEAKFPYIVNQLVNGRSVRDYLQAEGYVSWSQKVRMCTQAADGLTFLHSVKPNPITHRDIRCANLMITPEEVVIVVDFGVTAILEPVRQECSRAKCFCQKELSACPASIRWTAPEILSHSGGSNQYTIFTTSSDVYSFGMMMWEMINVMNPFPDIQAEVEVMEVVKSGGRPVIPSDEAIPARYRDLIRDCWDTEPHTRPTFKQVVSALKEAMTQARSIEKRNHHAHNMSSISSLQATVI